MLQLKFYNTANNSHTLNINNESNIKTFQILDHKEVDKSKFKLELATSSNLIIDPFVSFVKDTLSGNAEAFSKIEVLSDQSFTINLKDSRVDSSDFAAEFDREKGKIVFQCYIESIEE